jgi:transcription elongation GreA/GreB family factor
MLPKPRIHQACIDLLQSKIDALEVRIQDAQQAATEDTKSSAGDKFETAREMMKQEIDKASAQLATFQRMQGWLGQLRPEQVTEQVAFGSLLHSNEGIYYFAVSLGKITLDDHVVYALSMASPLGQALAGKRVGDQVTFRGRTLRIQDLR